MKFYRILQMVIFSIAISCFAKASSDSGETKVVLLEEISEVYDGNVWVGKDLGIY